MKVKVTHASKDSYLARVIKLVDDAQKTKSKTQLLADKAANILTIVALVAGFGTFFFWWLIAKEPMVFALERMVTVIVICCPHALGLAVPLVVAISTSLSAKHGLLIKNRIAFENARKITTIIFLYKWGIMLTPAAGAVLMSLSTIVVAINARMLKVNQVS